MAYKRTNISFFELSNAAYVSATVTFFQVDAVTNERLTTLITLYADTSSANTLSNPYTLDSGGKFSTPVYAIERFIAVIQDINGDTLTTGVWEPALSTADVTAAAASATAAAASALQVMGFATTAAVSAAASAVSAAAAAASAAAAAAAVGGVLVTSTDQLAQNLNSKVTVSGLVTKSVVNPTTTATLNIDVSNATDAQALAKASNTVALTPGNLAALDASTVKTGLMRFATIAEATTGTVSTAAVTPEGVAAATANTVTAVNADGGVFTNVSSGATVQAVVFNRYRMTGTTACSTKLPTFAINQWIDVEFACTTGVTHTVSRNAQTIDGTAADDTNTRYGDIIRYEATSVGTVRTMQIGVLPLL